jgi:transposase-like protein
MLKFKGMHIPIDAIPVRTRWYAPYPLSYRHLEEMMEERGRRRPVSFVPGCLHDMSFSV